MMVSPPRPTVNPAMVQPPYGVPSDKGNEEEGAMDVDEDGEDKAGKGNEIESEDSTAEKTPPPNQQSLPAAMNRAAQAVTLPTITSKPSQAARSKPRPVARPPTARAKGKQAALPPLASKKPTQAERLPTITAKPRPTPPPPTTVDYDALNTMASAIIKKGQGLKGLTCEQATRWIGTLMAIPDEKREQLLGLSQKAQTAGLLTLLPIDGKGKRKDVDHMKSPEHKRLRYRRPSDAPPSPTGQGTSRGKVLAPNTSDEESKSSTSGSGSGSEDEDE
jgi:hypothetical protein